MSGEAESLRLMPGVLAATGRDGEVYLLRWPHRESLGRLTETQRATLDTLAAGPCRAEQLAGGAEVSTLVNRLRARGWLMIEVTDAGRPLYAIRPVRLAPTSPAATDAPVALSRYAILRRDGAEWVLHSPLSWCEVAVLDPAVSAVLGLLSVPRSAADLRDVLGEPFATRLLTDLRWAGLVAPAEEAELRLGQWSPHELWFHERSRLGTRLARDSRAQGRFPPPPARRDPFPGPEIVLPRPDLDAVRAADPTLTEVLESRRSVLGHDDANPMNLVQLGEFLYRTAPVRAIIPTPDGDQFPSADAPRELEVYLAVRKVTGVAPGLYHYAGHEHRLRRVCPATPALRRLLTDAKTGSGLPETPQLVVVLAARFDRLMSTYQSYALILKKVGVLFQQMYLVATAMGLASCALDSGDSGAFAEATGLDPLEECSVGELILGSRP